MARREVGLSLLLGGVSVRSGAPRVEADECARTYAVSAIEDRPPYRLCATSDTGTRLSPPEDTQGRTLGTRKRPALNGVGLLPGLVRSLHDP